MRYANVMDLKQPLYELSSKISSTISMVDSNYENIQYDRNHEEEAFLADEFRRIVMKLDEVNRSLSYLQKPITEEGILHKNELGRYELPSGYYFTSGSTIEAFVYDDFDETFRWVHSRIEHTNGDYYLYGYKDVSLEGLKARVRG